MRSNGRTTLDSPRSGPTGLSPLRESTGEYSARLAALGAFALRHKALVIGAWIGAAVILDVVFPQLETVVRHQSVQLLPNDVASFRAVDDWRPRLTSGAPRPRSSSQWKTPQV
ncbi:hypothetical protein [Mycobacterium sp. TY815]|uniref:hypothetical protein n=1 Tax=Mycobacterium sp. TY815 TaxID=3050581 RepID=UPI003532520C